jgi:DNA-binding NarL/FixJ family response regulator
VTASIASENHPLRIVIVDDHALVRDAIRRALEGPDLEVVAEADSAEDALTIVPQLAPDVLLVDIHLPGMSGVDLVRELGPRLTKTSIVMLTASGSVDDVLRALRYGAVGYLTKDVEPEALRRAVRGIRTGDLPMPRRMAGLLIRRLLRGQTGDPAIGLDALSEREREVLGLLAIGLTNRQIAARLVVSPRTAEAHVRKILRKLDVRNRAEAARQFDASSGGSTAVPIAVHGHGFPAEPTWGSDRRDQQRRGPSARTVGAEPRRRG